MLKVPDVTKRYGVSMATVLGWIASGELAAVDVAPKAGKRKFWRITEQALADFELKRSNPTTTPRRIKPPVRQYV